MTGGGARSALARERGLASARWRCRWSSPVSTGSSAHQARFSLAFASGMDKAMAGAGRAVNGVRRSSAAPGPADGGWEGGDWAGLE
jgi:hypothetical protein